MVGIVSLLPKSVVIRHLWFVIHHSWMDLFQPWLVLEALPVLFEVFRCAGLVTIGGAMDFLSNTVVGTLISHGNYLSCCTDPRNLIRHHPGTRYSHLLGRCCHLFLPYKRLLFIYCNEEEEGR